MLSHNLKNGCVSKLLRLKFLSCFLSLKITTREEFTVGRLRCRRKLNRVDIPSAHCCLETSRTFTALCKKSNDFLIMLL